MGAAVNAVGGPWAIAQPSGDDTAETCMSVCIFSLLPSACAWVCVCAWWAAGNSRRNAQAHTHTEEYQELQLDSLAGVSCRCVLKQLSAKSATPDGAVGESGFLAISRCSQVLPGVVQEQRGTNK